MGNKGCGGSTVGAGGTGIGGCGAYQDCARGGTDQLGGCIGNAGL